jgi:flagellar L-ring protein FlgH
LKYKIQSLVLVAMSFIADGKDRNLGPLQKLLNSNGGKSALDSYLEQSGAIPHRPVDLTPTPGSAYHPGGLLGDLTRDRRGSGIDDLITINVNDQASAVSKGATNTSRKSSTKTGVNALMGVLPATNPLTNLAGATGSTQIQGTGETSRSTSISTTVTAYVTHVMSNGNLAVRGVKDIWVNSERQLVEVRGIIRPGDLTSGNQITSDKLALLEIRINGKGVVNDAVKRPFFLYRILLGLLPF